MDEYIKQSIEARRGAIEGNCKLDAEGKKKVAELFAEIEKLGVKCKDVTEFEMEFQKSPLNQKYLDLFTELATKGVAAGGAGAGVTGGAGVTKGAVGSAKVTVAKSVAGGIASGVADRAVNEAMNSVLPTRAAVHQKVSDAARSVPVLGDAIDAGQKASYLGHLAKVFKKKKNH